jgi:hypothetical protein
MFGVIGTAPATKALPAQKHPPAKAIANILTADWFWALCILLGAILVPSPAANATTVLGLPKLCIFRNVTGISCPGCGMTRSLIATGHGHVDTAIEFHPLGPFIFALIAVCVLTGINDTLPNPNRLLQRVKAFSRWPLLLCSAAFGVIWILRITHVMPTPP